MPVMSELALSLSCLHGVSRVIKSLPGGLSGFKSGVAVDLGVSESLLLKKRLGTETVAFSQLMSPEPTSDTSWNRLDREDLSLTFPWLEYEVLASAEDFGPKFELF